MQNQFEPASIVKAQKTASKRAREYSSADRVVERSAQHNAANKKVLYRSSIDVARRVYRDHGIRTTFRGTNATLIRDITYGQYFGQYEWMKRKFIGESEATATKAAACALAGGISGLVGWFFIYPL